MWGASLILLLFGKEFFIHRIVGKQVIPTFYCRGMKFSLKKGIITNVWLRLVKIEPAFDKVMMK
ncbi:hypothetical protein CQ127_09700 [Listeria monocytogenes]|nr:hypothetical protein [Listeria monocytogenes]EAF2698491.1 hypothetical protein [Listeria monocytogenes]EAF2761770.1 hypothetical protein [Listeria monocytogenes]EAF5358576.1 hypothetical protein [Listeria monocytogenes]EAF9820978.1 hypothetical protein [Listeria monocytogenes]